MEIRIRKFLKHLLWKKWGSPCQCGICEYPYFTFYLSSLTTWKLFTELFKREN